MRIKLSIKCDFYCRLITLAFIDQSELIEQFFHVTGEFTGLKEIINCFKLQLKISCYHAMQINIYTHFTEFIQDLFSDTKNSSFSP